MTDVPTFDSPEQAAMSSFPAKYCRVVASRSEGDDAYVLLDTGSDGRMYLYGINCSRQGNGWIERGSANAPTWAQAGPDPALGTLVAWGEMPPGADAARVGFGDATQDADVNAGAYLAVWWRVPTSRSISAATPGQSGAIAFRIDGVWVPEA